MLTSQLLSSHPAMQASMQTNCKLESSSHVSLVTLFVVLVLEDHLKIALHATQITLTFLQLQLLAQQRLAELNVHLVNDSLLLPRVVQIVLQWHMTLLPKRVLL